VWYCEQFLSGISVWYYWQFFSESNTVSAITAMINLTWYCFCFSVECFLTVKSCTAKQFWKTRFHWIQGTLDRLGILEGVVNYIYLNIIIDHSNGIKRWTGMWPITCLVPYHVSNHVSNCMAPIKSWFKLNVADEMYTSSLLLLLLQHNYYYNCYYYYYYYY